LNVLNNLYPELGDKFKDEFLEALVLFVHGQETQSKSGIAARAELSRSVLLTDQWANWYGTHRAEIEGVINLRKPIAK
jgi:hypothetical protein